MANVPEDVVSALVALGRGNATAPQQITALAWILTDVCRVTEIPDEAWTTRQSLMREGRKAAGLEIAAASRINFQMEAIDE